MGGEVHDYPDPDGARAAGPSIVRLLGRPMPQEQAAAKRGAGFLAEDMQLFAHATLAWHMRFVASIYPTWDARHADVLLRRSWRW